MRGKQIIEEIDFLKSQGEGSASILGALRSASVNFSSLRRLLSRNDREDLIEILFPRIVPEATIHEHGDVRRYNAGCRCLPCRDANNDYAIKKRKERTGHEKDPNDPRHGQSGFYRNHGCRCQPCSAAHREECAAQYQQRLSRPIDPADPRHGTMSFYTAFGCRCDRCKESRRAYDAGRNNQ